MGCAMRHERAGWRNLPNESASWNVFCDGPAVCPVVTSMIVRTVVVAILSIGTGSVLANSPPDPPRILEPSAGGPAVSPWDVHMVTAAFSDPNRGDRHRCTDWEIRTAEEKDLVWSARCTSGPLALHVHLGDGSFQDTTALSYDADLVLLVRHFDSSGDAETDASLWSERPFRTGERSLIHPMILAAVSDDPPPRWTDSRGQPVELSDSDVTLSILGERDAAPMSRFAGSRWQSSVSETGGGHHPALVIIESGIASLDLQDTTLEIFDQDLVLRRIYLPPFSLAGGAVLALEVASDGATYYDETDRPPFASLARASETPWTIENDALRIERIATGFQLPVDLAFAPPTDEPDGPWLYVAELYGAIRLIRRDGSISTYAENLLDFGAEGPFPGEGEQGIGGIAIDPRSGDLFVSLPRVDGKEAPAPRVIRLHSLDEGRTASISSLVLELEGVEHVASHQISNVTLGPDRKLYVHVGDGSQIELASNPDVYTGKILRLNLDGSAPADNPFYDSSDGITARDYVFALGLRNPFGGDWRAANGRLYVVDNGPGHDRLIEAAPARDYLWNGSDESMFHYALFNWVRAAPVRLAFLQLETFGGSGFPEDYLDAAVVTESGPTWAAGPQTRGKRLTLLRFGVDGQVESAEELVRYAGFGRGTAAALAAGEDGIYFSDLYPDSAPSPFDHGASIFRIRYGGVARFGLHLPPDDSMAVQVADESDLPDVQTRSWRFGDEVVSSANAVTHRFSTPGVHEIRLFLGTEREDRIARAFVSVGDAPGTGLRAEYFDGWTDEGGPVVTRIEPSIDHDWGAGAPDPDLPADEFMGRWSGSLIPRITGTYVFETIGDDGVRLWINGHRLIDAWHPGWSEGRGSVELAAGQEYSVRLEYFEHQGDAKVHLLWTPPFGEREVVPPSVLYRPSGRSRTVGRTVP